MSVQRLTGANEEAFIAKQGSVTELRQNGRAKFPESFSLLILQQSLESSPILQLIDRVYCWKRAYLEVMFHEFDKI